MLQLSVNQGLSSICKTHFIETETYLAAIKGPSAHTGTLCHGCAPDRGVILTPPSFVDRHGTMRTETVTHGRSNRIAAFTGSEAREEIARVVSRRRTVIERHV